MKINRSSSAPLAPDPEKPPIDEMINRPSSASVIASTSSRFDVRPTSLPSKYIANDPQAFRDALDAVAQRLDSVGEADWNADTLDTAVRGLAESLGLGLGGVMQPIRIAITGTAVSEPVNVLLNLVGRAESLARIRAAAEWAGSAP